MQHIKNFIKRFWPVSIAVFFRELDSLRNLITGRFTRLSTRMDQQFRQLTEQSRKTNEQLAQISRQLKQQAETQHALEKRLNDRQTFWEKRQSEEKAQLAALSSEHRQQFDRLLGEVNASCRSADEAVWAAIFNNSITHCDWLKNRQFAPGRWALGYPALYVLFRVLNEARPKHILELGLGQSTRLCGQYAAAFEDVEHIVVEHDASWIEFFKNDFPLSERSQLLQLDREMTPFEDAEAVRSFAGFQKAMAGKKFDLILIDAPLGSDMKEYSRVDVARILPDCVEESFAIILDDFNRIGEKHTAEVMKRRLEEAGVEYANGRYCGQKTTYILTSADKKFLCTM